MKKYIVAALVIGATAFSIIGPLPGGPSSGGGGISSINGDTTAAQTIIGAGSVSVGTAGGVTTVTGAASGITSLNGLTGATQTFATGTTGTDFGISSAGTVHTYNLPVSSAVNTGKLSSTDWSTFDSKQPAGSYITDLTSDVTASGPGSSVATLATVNANIGSFTSANITVNAKGLITAAANGSSTPGGLNTQVQFNNAGTLDGDSKFTFNDTTGQVYLTPAGNGLFADVSASTDTQGVVRVYGAVPANQTFIGSASNMLNNGGTGAVTAMSATVSDGGSGTNSNAAVGVRSSVSSEMTAKTLAPFLGSQVGSFGALVSSTTGTTLTGGAFGIAGRASASNQSVGAHFYVDGAVGTTPKNYGVRSIVSSSGGAQAVGFYGKLGTTDGSTLEGSTSSVSGVAVFDNGDTTSPMLVLKDGGVTRFLADDMGATTITPSGALSSPGLSLNTSTQSGQISFDINDARGNADVVDTININTSRTAVAGGISSLKISQTGSSSAYALGLYVNQAMNNTTNGMDPFSGSTFGNIGSYMYSRAGSTTGSAAGAANMGYDSKTVVGTHSFGVNPRDVAGASGYGVRGFASGKDASVNTSQRVGVFGWIAPTTVSSTSALENRDPGVSAAGVFSNTTSTDAILVAQDDSTTVFKVSDGGQITSADGTTAAPEYSFISDPTKGMSSPSSDGLTLSGTSVAGTGVITFNFDSGATQVAQIRKDASRGDALAISGILRHTADDTWDYGKRLDGVLQRPRSIYVATSVVLATNDTTEVGSVTTSNATQTTAFTEALVNNTVYECEADVAARRTDAADRAGYKIMVTAYREAAGACTIQGTVDSAHTAESDSSWDATFTCSGNDLLVSVTGAGGKTVNWTATVHCKYAQ
jgi:hypothetical protein